MSEFGDIGGAEHHGGVPVAGQGASAAYGKSDDRDTRRHDADQATRNGKIDPEHLPNPPRSGPGAIGTGP